MTRRTQKQLLRSDRKYMRQGRTLDALRPDRVLLPDADEDLWSEHYRYLVGGMRGWAPGGDSEG